MIDVLDYASTIKDVLYKMRVRRSTWEDAEQECYVALLEKQEHLERSTDPKRYAATLCRNRLTDLYRQESQQQPGHKSEINARLVSLSDPKVSNWVGKIPQSGRDVTDEQLEEAILSLPYDEYVVIHGLFIEEKSQEKLAEDFGLTRSVVRTRMENGIAELKLYFEVE